MARVLAQQHLGPGGPPFARFVPAACVLHRGAYGEVAAAYEAAEQWLSAHGYGHTAPPWESYLDGPDVNEPRTQIFVPCGRAAADGTPQ